MQFRVLSHLDGDAVYEGLIIDYEVRPLFGIRTHWRTKIIQVDEGKSFTDIQLKGPYKYWKHFHEFTPNDTGVLMKDVVSYQIPLGFFGNLVNLLIVNRKLKVIFDHRHEVLERMYG
jgi:ligand-binding SRPBCC domain-containing protein